VTTAERQKSASRVFVRRCAIRVSDGPYDSCAARRGAFDHGYYPEVTDVWALIEESAGQADRAGWIERRLASQRPSEIVEFDIAFTAARRRAETWTMWAAGYRITSGLCSTDGFWYFLPWLVGLGREHFDRVVADPDALADVSEVRRLAMLTMERWTDDDWPQWEELATADHVDSA